MKKQVDSPQQEATWSALFRAPYLGPVSILAGGVFLYAMNLYFTAALLPTIIEDIGGQALYSWVATGFLLAAVTATMLVDRLLSSRGSRGAYLLAFAVFAAGAVVMVLSPNIIVLVLGRIVQGLGGGLLVGLGFACVRLLLPEALWQRTTALVAAMWAFGTLLGPALGGLFGQFGGWRLAYATLVLPAVLLILLSYRAIRPATSKAQPRRVPLGSLLVLAAAALCFSLASSLEGLLRLLCVLLGVAALIAFVLIERKSATTVLPAATYRRDSGLKWVYLSVAALSAGVMVESFVPLFGHRLPGLNPLLAGLLGAALSAGWSVSQLVSAGLAGRRARGSLLLGPVLLTGGLLCYGLLQSSSGAPLTVVAWAILLFIAGAGIGLAYPQLSVAALRSSQDDVEAAKAGAGLSTVQLIAYTMSASIGGILLNLGDDQVTGARAGILGIAGLTAFAIVFAVRARSELKSS
ncbi:MFS transporter [Psychromicrobium sp. YIM B11713]|uniref:MFS transporter n=1 Tax=Psychromicrobium sp. YIM B11713 TaxID=3145233 RepID=UPI00374EE4B4